MTYKPREVSRIVGIPRSRLRSWREKGIVEPSARVASGNQALYTESEVKLISAAWYLSRQGVTTQQLRAIVPLLPGMLSAAATANHS